MLAIVYHLFGATLFRETDPLSALYCAAFERLIPWAYRKTPIVAISKSTKDELVGRGLRAEQIETIYCGLDAARFCLSSRAKPATPLLLVVSRLKRYKCVDHPIRAMPRILSRFPAARLVIAGDGDDRPRLERLVHKLKIDRHVELRGAVSEAEKVDWLRRAHLFLNTSHKEGWGLTTIEANACGTPVIAAEAINTPASLVP